MPHTNASGRWLLALLVIETVMPARYNVVGRCHFSVLPRPLNKSFFHGSGFACQGL